MAYAAIANIIPQYDEQDSWWLKFYLPNTTTPISMATDSTGGTLLAKCQLDIDGFPTTDGTTLFIPFLNKNYDAYLFPTAAEADANNTVNAKRVAKNINPFGDDVSVQVTKLKVTIPAGETTFTITDTPDAINIIDSGAMQEEAITSPDYVYDSSTGIVSGLTPLGANREVEVQYGVIAPITTITIDGVIQIGSVAQMIAVAGLSVGDRVQTYTYNATVLCDWSIIAANTGAGDMSDGALNLTGSSLQARLVIQPVMTPKHFGAIGGGLADDTVTVQNCLNVCPNTLVNEPYGVTSVTALNYVDFAATGKLIALGASNSRVLTITSRKVGDIVVDGNANDVNCIYFPAGLGYAQKYNTLDYSNVAVVVTSGTTNTGVTMFGDDVAGGAIYGDNMVNTGHSNDSFPQGCVTGLGRYHIESHDIKNSRSGFVTTGGNVFLGTNRCTNMVDNGCYLLGGDVVIGTNSYEGAEEATQINAVKSATIGEIVARGRTLGAFNYQNSGVINIGMITGVPSVDYDDPLLPSNVPTSICYARSGNVTTGEVRIGQVRGYFMEGIATNAGTCDKFTLGDTDVTLCYAPSQTPLNKWVVNPTSANPWDWRGCNQVSRQDITINIKNFEATAWPAGIISVQHPTFAKFSSIDNEVFNLLEVDDTLAGSQIEYRGGRPQELLVYSNVHWHINAGSINMREAEEAGFQMNATTAAPSNGYWRAGQILQDRSGTNVHFICTVTGTPGTWVTK